MSDVAFVDFRNGMVSEKLRRRSDLSFYQNSASLIENAVPLRTGGVRRREGLSVQVKAILTKAEKIVPIVRDDDNYYILAFSPMEEATETTDAVNGMMYVCRPNEDGTYDVTTRTNSLYTSKDLETICVAHTYDMIVIAQKNHYPQVIKYSKADNSISEMSDFVPVTKYSIYRNGELQPTSTFAYTYDTYLNRNNKDWYPSGCAFVANRLVFYGFKACPYGFIMSHPFEYMDFTESVKYEKTVSKLSSERFSDAVAQLQKTDTTELKDYVHNGTTYEKVFKKEETTVSTVGYFITTIAYVDNETAQVLTTDVETKVLDESKTSWDETTKKWNFVYKVDDKGNIITTKGAVYFSADKTEYSSTITDDCAIFLELASDRDERICWLGQVGDNVYVGTTSSEWIMPSSITATQVQCSKLASYGSAIDVKCAYGMRNLFYVQLGGKKIRSVQYTQDGPAFSEVTYTCPELFSDGIKEIVWQKVPEPRMYVNTKNDNELAVYCYDADYGVNAWCRWTFDQGVQSVCVLDTKNGQEVFVLMADHYLYKFEEGKIEDDSIDHEGESVGFIPVVKTNNIESTSLIAMGKKNYKIYADTLGTKFKARAITGSLSNGNAYMECRTVNEQLSKIEAYSVYPNDQGLRVEVQGMKDEDFVLLAIVVEMEVQR